MLLSNQLCLRMTLRTKKLITKLKRKTVEHMKVGEAAKKSVESVELMAVVVYGRKDSFLF